jgi:hypothetical protein
LGNVTWAATWPGLLTLAAGLLGLGAFSMRGAYRLVD